MDYIINKFYVVYNSNETHLYERPRLNHILNTMDGTDCVSYLHTKEVRFNGKCKSILDCVDLMKYIYI